MTSTNDNFDIENWAKWLADEMTPTPSSEPQKIDAPDLTAPLSAEDELQDILQEVEDRLDNWCEKHQKPLPNATTAVANRLSNMLDGDFETKVKRDAWLAIQSNPEAFIHAWTYFICG